MRVCLSISIALLLVGHASAQVLSPGNPRLLTDTNTSLPAFDSEQIIDAAWTSDGTRFVLGEGMQAGTRMVYLHSLKKRGELVYFTPLALAADEHARAVTVAPDGTATVVWDSPTGVRMQQYTVAGAPIWASPATGGANSAVIDVILDQSLRPVTVGSAAGMASMDRWAPDGSGISSSVHSVEPGVFTSAVVDGTFGIYACGELEIAGQLDAAIAFVTEDWGAQQIGTFPSPPTQDHLQVIDVDPVTLRVC